CLLDDAPGHPGAEDGADHGKSAGQAEEAHQCGDLNAHQCGPGEASPLASPFGQGLKASTAMMMKMPITGTRWSSERAPEKPARVQMRQVGMIRTRATMK